MCRLRPEGGELRFLTGGEAPTIADAFVAPVCVVALRYVDDPTELSALLNWLAALHKHPGFEAALSDLDGRWPDFSPARWSRMARMHGKP